MAPCLVRMTEKTGGKRLKREDHKVLSTRMERSFIKKINEIYKKENRYLNNKKETYIYLDTLLEQGARFHPFMVAYAASKCHIDMVHFFVERGGNINHNGILEKPKRNYGTPLMNALRMEEVGLVRYLLENGASPDVAEHSEHALYYPINEAGKINEESVRLLLMYGATLNGRTFSTASRSCVEKVLSEMKSKKYGKDGTMGFEQYVSANRKRAVRNLTEHAAQYKWHDAESE